ncbi:MAG: D-glycero-beta-D-manno-heptose 1,7-bisphosphate 7-phosphatase [Deltaproteobacteria bacterium]|jgi:D-glycero-D-manno-heptose 1,7-bisphosphate phosphatase|nr:D-glycero-beta-D-manno-heptose 1,7-bisphosphate 7-phosphatase [Deltaproteobacteria bacterium]
MNDGAAIFRPAVFMDRDGTLNHDESYIHKFEEFRWIDRVPEALAQLKRAGLALVVVTNQSGVNRGYYDRQDLLKLHREVGQDLLARVGVKIDGWYFCPHNPLTDNCDCRKPAPGMLIQATKDLFLDPAESYMVGDKFLDVQAGLAMGVKRTILVLTGYGESERKYVSSDTLIVNNFPEAAEYILNDFSASRA